MKKQINMFIGFVFLMAAGLGLKARAQSAPAQNQSVGTAFSYQGVLTDGGQPANGAYDLQFALFDAASSGNQLGSTVTVDNQEVSDGLLAVQLDFGQNVFTGSPRYLEIRVRPGSSSGSYETLGDRQPLQASPYAIHAGSATALSDAEGEAVVQVGAGGNVGVGLDDPAANVHILGNLSHPLTGTVTVGANSVNVVGVGTLFTQELAAGDALLIGTERFTVQTILSDIDLTLDRPHPTGALNEVAYTDSDLFMVQNGDGVTTLVMNKSGNLGIGTIDPYGTLSLYEPVGSASDADLTMQTAHSSRWWISADTTNNQFLLGGNGATRPTDDEYAITITVDDNVGIGTTNPNNRLSVDGNLEVGTGPRGTILASSYQDNFQLFTYTNTPNPNFFIGYGTGNGGYDTSKEYIFANGGHISFMNANVGIGTTSPTATLHVDGNLNFTGQKACRVTDTGNWSQLTLVPASWTSPTCESLRAVTAGNNFHLVCIFYNSFSMGTANGGIPNPNCGW